MKANLLLSQLALLITVIAATSSRAATVTWTNTSGGNWSVAANWSPNQVPGSSDDAVIIMSGTYSVTLDTTPIINSLILGGASGTQTLDTAGNSLTVVNPSTINSNGVFALNGGSLAGVFSFGGTLNWESGTLNNGATLTVASNGVLNIEGSITIEGALTNAGTVNWQAGQVNVYDPVGGYEGAIWNQAGALWDIQCDQNLAGVYGGEEFSNAGLVQKDTTTGTTTFTTYLANSGTVQAQSGILQLYGGYSNSPRGKPFGCT